MEKISLHSATPDLTKQNIDKIAKLFPNCITEAKNDKGEVTKKVDFEILKQELSNEIVDGEKKERYQLNWPGKKKSLNLANTPISETLRPDREQSVDFDTTKNLFIEGDNLDALKLLQSHYHNKVKMIYIDPPYNTGKDFIYKDNFKKTREEELQDSGQKDEEGNRLEVNPESNGRYHSDWLSMMYSRLKIARNLLKDDGVIFISIDDNEVHNLRKICDEIFGEDNFRNSILVRRRIKSLNSQFSKNGLQTLNVGFENVLVYSKNNSFLMKALRTKKRDASKKGRWDVFWSNADRPTMRYDILDFIPKTGQWRYSKEKAVTAVENYKKYQDSFSDEMSLEEYWKKTGSCFRFIRRIDNGKGKNGGVQHWVAPSNTILRTSNWTDIEVSQIHKEIDLPFDNPKNIDLPQELIKLASVKNSDLIFDFFAGSSTTAHAVMQLNAEDGGKRKFIMVQYPEDCGETTEAYKAGYKTIAEISKERIRRAGKKVVADLEEQKFNELYEAEVKRLKELEEEKNENEEDKKKKKSKTTKLDDDKIAEFKETAKAHAEQLDIGFRTLKIDSTNLNDVTKNPDEFEQKELFDLEKNLKADRTSEDLLFHAMLEGGLDLSLPIVKKTIQDTEVFFVDRDALVACFDKDGKVTEELCNELAKRKPSPLRVVFRDEGFASDSVKINAEQIFKQLSENTQVKSI